MTSAVYTQASGSMESFAGYSRRRLDFEALRDSLLSVSGQLDTGMGGRSVELTGAQPSGRRAVYGFIDRQNLPSLFRTFDFASPDTTSPQRYETTVPQQALFMMNSPFVLDCARALTTGAGEPTSEPRERIHALHRLIYARNATAGELALGLSFVSSGSGAAWHQYAQALLLANEFVFVD